VPDAVSGEKEPVLRQLDEIQVDGAGKAVQQSGLGAGPAPVRSNVQLVLGQATFARLMVSARRMTLRSPGSVACRFRRDVAADHAGLCAMTVVIGAVEGEVAQRGELGLDPVEPGAVEQHVGEFDVVRRRPVTDAPVGPGRPVWAEVVAHDRDPHPGRVQRAQVAAEGQELGAVLTQLDVAVEPIGGQVVAGPQMPDPVRAVVSSRPQKQRPSRDMARKKTRRSTQPGVPV
jgi:hypothetical protein